MALSLRTCLSRLTGRKINGVGVDCRRSTRVIMVHMTIPPRFAALGGAFAVAAALLAGPVAGSASAAPTATAASVSVESVGNVCYSALPSQAHDTISLIDQGGPFPYPRDG